MGQLISIPIFAGTFNAVAGDNLSFSNFLIVPSAASTLDTKIIHNALIKSIYIKAICTNVGSSAPGEEWMLNFQKTGALLSIALNQLARVGVTNIRESYNNALNILLNNNDYFSLTLYNPVIWGTPPQGVSIAGLMCYETI
ncbi:MAG: hypothetical protein WCX48_10995 [Bacteroidales bacterium]|jgi:hypothetical protein